jgi:hypothetical protein
MTAQMKDLVSSNKKFFVLSKQKRDSPRPFKNLMMSSSMIKVEQLWLSHFTQQVNV